MGLQAQRIVKLIVGPPGRLGREIGGLSRDSTRIIFSTEKTSKKHPNKCKIEIYNLDPSTAAFIESDEVRNRVQLFAGYTGVFGGDAEGSPAPGLIFSGEIRKGKARTKLQPPHRITTIEASDGGAGYRSARINKSFSGGVTAFEVIDEIAKTYNLGIAVPDDVTDIPIEGGFVAQGPSRDVLESLGTSLGFEFYFEDDELKIVAKEGDTGEEAYLLTPSTGLVDSPQKTDKGLNITSLLNPSLRVRRIIRVESNDVEGWYRIQKLEHKGDSYEGTFNTIMECKAVTAGRSPTKAAKDVNRVAKIRKAVIGAGYMFPTLSAAVAFASAPQFGFGNVFICEFSSSEYGLVTQSEATRLLSQRIIFERDGQPLRGPLQ